MKEITLYPQIKRKDFIESPFNYTGSKYDLLGLLTDHLPKQKFNVLYDLFAGGGSFFTNIECKYKCVNDIIEPLIEFYQFLQKYDWPSVTGNIKIAYIDKDDQEGYEKLRSRFNESKDPIDFFMLLCTCTNNMVRFNKKGEFNQTWGKRSYNKNTERKLKAYHDKIHKNDRIIFGSTNFDSIKMAKDGFVYLDPPYLITEAGYSAHWSENDEKRLLSFINLLDSEQIPFMLSNVAEHKGKTHPYLDQWKKYKIVDLKYSYDKVSKNGQSNSREVIVLNY